MAQYKASEDPIKPLSPQGLFKSSFVLLYIFKARPTPQISFLVATVLWICFFFAPLQWTDACLTPGHVHSMSADDWKVWAFHAFAQDSFLRTSLIGTLLLTLGYSCEDLLGIWHFLALFVGLHFGLGTLMLFFDVTSCYQSVEYTLVAFAPIFHSINPILYGDSIAENIRVPFAIEPRWHYWLLVFVLMVTKSQFIAENIYAYFAGLVLGILYVVRQPEAWNFRITLMWPKQLIFLLVVLFVPVTTVELGVWSGPSVVQLAQNGFLGEGDTVVRLSLSLLPLCALAANVVPLFPKVVYSVSSGLLAMYSMNSPAWGYPGPGFLALFLLAIAFLLKK